MLLRSLRNWIALGCITVLITACGGGSGGGNTSAGSSSGTSSSSSSSGSSTSSGSSATTPTPVSYAVQLSWTPPSTRADGSALTASELAGYRVYYALEGSASSQDTVVPISSGATTSLQVTLNSAGTYTFAITALDQNGLESSLSTPVSVAVN